MPGLSDRDKWVRGSNAELGGNYKHKHATTVESGRVHQYDPGDVGTCGCCGKTMNNPYQHFDVCVPSHYYKMIQDKFREAYLYLLQRNHEWPDTYEHPGQFIMMATSNTLSMMQRVPMSLLKEQADHWNVLMPLMVTKNNGELREGKTFFEHLEEMKNEEFEEMFYKVTDKSITEELRGDFESELGVNYTWQREICGNTYCKKYDLKHDVYNSMLRFTKKEQQLMETTHAKLYTRHEALAEQITNDEGTCKTAIDGHMTLTEIEKEQHQQCITNRAKRAYHVSIMLPCLGSGKCIVDMAVANMPQNFRYLKGTNKRRSTS